MGSSIKDVLAKTDFLTPPPPLSNIVRLEDTTTPVPGRPARIAQKMSETQHILRSGRPWTGRWGCNRNPKRKIFAQNRQK